jgi:hypothetical protein
MSVLLRPELDTFTANAYDAVRLVTIDNKANVIVTLPTLGDKLRRVEDAL